MGDTYKLAAAYLKKHALLKPEVGIICGSGLSELSTIMTDQQVFQYSKIPGFPAPTVQGHAGELVFGKLGGVAAVCMRGRFHFYEGHPMSLVVMPVRMMRCLGVKIMIVTNAAGGINPDLTIGDVLCMNDHLGLPCLSGFNPLMGANDSALGPRFLPTSNVYNKEMQAVVMNSAKSLGFDFVRPTGCYCMVSGPTYESATEGLWLRKIGVDTVGMSTVPEIIAAHHCGMKVIGFSLVTNKVVMPGDSGPAASHEEVLEAVGQRAKQMQELVKRIVENLQDELKAMPALSEINLSVKKIPKPKAAMKKASMTAKTVNGKKVMKKKVAMKGRARKAAAAAPKRAMKVMKKKVLRRK